MVKRVQFSVDEDLIAAGIRRHSSYCMIAEALKRALPEAMAVSVDLSTIRWSDKEQGLRYIYVTPLAAQQAIVDFDQGKADRLKPFKVRLKNGQIVPMRTAEHRRERAGSGKGNSPRTGQTLVVGKDGATTATGGKPMPVNPALPARMRIYGARQLTP